MWATLGPFEKYLYYWVEVNAFALEFETKTNAPSLRLKCEDLFDGDGLDQILKFLILPARDGVSESRNNLIDDFRF